MAWATDSIELSSKKVTVRSITPEDIDKIVEAIHDPTGWSGRIWGIDTPEKIRTMLERQIESHQRHEQNPLVYFVEGTVAGITRLHSLYPNRKALEIGGTCVAPKWRRTFVNTEVKKLLLQHAFEKLEAVRVELRVDCKNYVSQMNVLRLGAQFEGVIRHWQVRPDGSLPHGMLYSLTNTDWPQIQKRLDCLQNRLRPEDPYLPSRLETENLVVELQKLADSVDLLNLIDRNKPSLIDSFTRTSSIENLEEAQAAIAEWAHGAAAGTTFYYGVREKTTRQLIGQFHIKQVNWKSMSVELVYFVDADFRRKGIATQLINLAVTELFTKRIFRRITAHIHSTNQASINLALKLGFHQEGLLRKISTNRKGESIDTCVFSRLAPDQNCDTL